MVSMDTGIHSAISQQVAHETRTVRRFLFIILGLAFGFSFGFLVVDLLGGPSGETVLLAIGASVSSSIFVYVWKTGSVEFPANLLIVFLYVGLVHGLLTGGFMGKILVFTYPMPTIVFLLAGRRAGTRYITAFLVLYLAFIVLDRTSVLAIPFGTPELVLNFVALLNVVVFTHYYQVNKERYTEIVKQQLITDPLTELPNRRKLVADVENAQDPVLFLVNVDYFREINSVFGPRVGDAVLQELASLLASELSEDAASLYHLHGDEFGLLLEQTDRALSDAKVARFAGRIADRIAGHVFLSQEQGLRLRASVGVANRRVIGARDLLTRADTALKEAKRNGRPYMLFKDAAPTERQHEESIRWLGLLTRALSEDRITAHFQPIFRADGRSIHSYEALARVIGSDGTVYGPAKFLGVAKKSKLYPDITARVIERAVEFLDAGAPGVSVNVSVEDLLSETTLSFIRTVLERRPRGGDGITFELVESEGIDRLDRVRSFIELVKQAGATLAIDDFGSGYSNFRYLAELSIDYIKIDGSLIRDVDTSVQARSVAKTVQAFAHTVGVQTVAEFVHNESVLNTVRDLGVTFVQGYYLGRPAPAAAHLESLTKTSGRSMRRP